MNVIRNLLKKAVGHEEHRVLMLALDAAGRTTILYKWKAGEVVTTIPTIGFNVETVSFGGVDVTLWDVGGCDKIRPLWRHYYQNTTLVIWMQDANDRERIDEARDELEKVLREDELRDAPILFLLSKQDLPNAMRPAEAKERMRLNELFRGRVWDLVPTSIKDEASVHRALERLVEMCREIKAKGPSQVKEVAAVEEEKLVHLEGKEGMFKVISSGTTAQVQSVDSGEQFNVSPRLLRDVVFEPSRAERKAEGMASMFIGWLKRVDEDDNSFLAKIKDYTYESWDHYTHLRFAYVLLSRHGRSEAIPKIFDGIRFFIENSSVSRGKTFHVTMTMFWVQMIDFSIKQGRSGNWKEFLLFHPVLANGGLYLHYYSKDVMMTPKAKYEVVLPDRNPLPSLLSDVVSRKAIANDNVQLKPPMPSAAFLASVATGTFGSWSHEQYIRVIFEVLLERGRKQGKDLIFDYLKRVQKGSFNITLACFWLHMVHLALQKVGIDAMVPSDPNKRPSIEFVRQPCFAEASYKKFYSEAALDKGKEEFFPPDLEKLPMTL